MGCSKNVRVLGRKENHVAWDGGVEGGGGFKFSRFGTREHLFFLFSFFFRYLVHLCWNLRQQRAVTAYLVASQLPDDVGRLHFLGRNIIGSRRRHLACQFPPRTKPLSQLMDSMLRDVAVLLRRVATQVFHGIGFVKTFYWRRCDNLRRVVWFAFKNQ